METVTVDFEEVDRWDQALRYLNPDELMNLWVEQGLAEHTVLKISGQENGVALAIELARRYKEWIERSLQRRMSHIVANIADKASNTLKLSFELGKGLHLFSGNTGDLHKETEDLIRKVGKVLKLTLDFQNPAESIKAQQNRLGKALITNGTLEEFHLASYEGQVMCCESRKKWPFLKYLKDNKKRVFQMDSFSAARARGDNYASVIKTDRTTGTFKISPLYNMPKSAHTDFIAPVVEEGLEHPLAEQNPSIGCKGCTLLAEPGEVIPKGDRSHRFYKQKENGGAAFYEKNGSTCNFNADGETPDPIVMPEVSNPEELESALEVRRIAEPPPPDFSGGEAIIPRDIYEKFQIFMEAANKIAVPRMTAANL